MLVAALDTATLTLSCALVDVSPGSPPRLRCDRTEHQPTKAGRAVRAKGEPDEASRERAGGPGGREQEASVPPARLTGHSARLPQALVDLLDVEGLAIPDVEAYAVGLGPGSFTGLRIGLATWKGLAYANRRPIAGVSSLAAMALAAAPGAEEGTILVPLLDARKGEVYAGFFRASEGGVVEVAGEVALSPPALVERLPALIPRGARPAAFGEGFEAWAAALGSLPRLATEVRTPPAGAVAALAADALARASFDAGSLFALEPHYVRPSEAELKFPQGLGPGAGGR